MCESDEPGQEFANSIASDEPNHRASAKTCSGHYSSEQSWQRRGCFGSSDALPAVHRRLTRQSLGQVAASRAGLGLWLDC
eukprot:429910-Alexandrium_andersonii.AAC.2